MTPEDDSRRILITGGAGYVGSICAGHLLKSGQKVRVLDCLLYGGESLLAYLGHEHFDFLRGDVRDPHVLDRALQDVDVVVHLAALVGDPVCKTAPQIAWEINFRSTCQLADAARKKGGIRFVFASTCSNYGTTAAEAYVTEEECLRPLSVYAESKVAAEQHLLGLPTGELDWVILRFATVYGVSSRMRFDLLVNDFVREAFYRQRLVVYAENSWRPYIHVRDVAQAVLLASRHPFRSGDPRVFNVGDTRENYSKGEVAQRVAARIPGTQVEIVRRGEDRRDYRVSFDRIRAVLGLRPRRTIADGVEEVLALLRDGVLRDPDAAQYSNTGIPQLPTRGAR